MTDRSELPRDTSKALAWQIRASRGGLLAESAVRAFWPLSSVLLATLAALMLGLHEVMALEVVWALGVAAILGAVWAAWRGVRAFRWPSEDEALERLDRTMPGRPIAAMTDRQAIGSGDPASEAVWDAHVRRMTERAKAARAPDPDLKLSSRDPYALRYVALLAFVMALIFGSFWRVASVTDIAPGGGSQALATGPAWEGWVEPPLYTGQPTLYLNDISREAFAVPEGSRVTLRFYGEIGDLALSETVSGRTADVPAATEPTQSFEITQAGRIAIDGPGGRAWGIDITPDTPPEVEFDGPMSRTRNGTEAPFVARDDYGVEGGTLEITLDAGAVERSHGLSVEPEPREPLVLDLPMPLSGDRTDMTEVAVEDVDKHPWVGLPVTARLIAEDARAQTGESETLEVALPGRRFFDPLAAAIAEQRRDLLWNRINAPRVAQVLRAVSYRPDEVFRSETAYLKLRFVIRRLETRATYDALDDEFMDETADALWEIALGIEEGDLGDALARLQRAQDRLSEAIENGATDEEIAELMQELREAMQDYMQQLAEEMQRNGDQQQAENQGEMQEITGDQLQDMLDRLQELMEQGRMAEAAELLEQLRQMMENMQMAQGQQGQGQQSPGEQAMEGLAETLRQQQGLSDEAFRDLQEQFNPDAQAGESQGNEGRDGNQGQGQQHGQQGQGQQGERQGQQGQGGQQQPGGQQGQGDLEGSLADRQGQLRRELNRQAQNLPGAGTPEGDAARESLGRAGDAMDEAEEDLRNEDFAGALDNQAEAMEALREGMRELQEQMAQQQGQQGQEGQQAGRGNPQGTRDPLGREAGENGRVGTDEQLLQGDDVYRRARELLDEIRRRSGEQERPEAELEYLKRLLDRF